LLSIVLGVRFIKVVTRKSLRTKGDKSSVTMAVQLEPSGSRKLDHVVGHRWWKNQCEVVIIRLMYFTWMWL